MDWIVSSQKDFFQYYHPSFYPDMEVYSENVPG